MNKIGKSHRGAHRLCRVILHHLAAIPTKWSLARGGLPACLAESASGSIVLSGALS